MNIKLAYQVVSRLNDLGVDSYLVCPGARNAPFIKVLNQVCPERVENFFDERAAGFFALGRAKRDQKCVAVVTTSGTAVAELLPAAIEAYYSGVSLVFLTADRPQSFRGTGSPQTIEQAGLFTTYAVNKFDIDKVEQVERIELATHAPIHVNVSFSEPLIDEDVALLSSLNEPAKPQSLIYDKSLFCNEEKLTEFFSTAERPLILLGGISNAYRSSVYEFLLKTYVPIYAEAISGLRESAALQSRLIKTGEKFFSQIDFGDHFDSVLRLGSVPTLRLWRDLETRLQDIKVLSVSDLPFSGLSRSNAAICHFNEFFNHAGKEGFSSLLSVTPEEAASVSHFEKLFSQFPKSEPSMIRSLASVIPQGSQVMLGNSLPIREWDLAAPFLDLQHQIAANRGANGIDGLIATFLGQAKSGIENWLVLGDLSALYDLNALAFSHVVSKNAILRVVVINNSGGQIFYPMFKDKNFINEHQLNFKKWAEMFNWDYQVLREVSGLNLTDRPTVIELLPDNVETQNFLKSYEGVWT